ncbi:TlpA family protein disulfide reductase [Mesoterricola silvestris]|uniref:Alkyl hydroperoxide reductase n=1 Tax=Mesoterricola silvestris TaxID=2927979 RepID=A0AA48KB34_9BACT|nr:TlpA disulfide reductase family protein [Mesoterricola silvestris]BDU74675.1 alkyl hydroperoxide reductase [Mesoterricola silvestris]
MKTHALLVGIRALALSVAATLCHAQFNSNPTLRIGDPAPPITAQAWVRGKPLARFEPGRVYVVDFWATWCGGCIMAFPHISGIARKYEDKVRFISVDSYEDLGENKGKDLAAAVRKFLQTPNGKRLTFDVAVDGAANTMYQAWIKPLRRNGFPTTFIIDQEGRIAWVDVNLDHLEWALDHVLAGTWDRNKAAQVMQERDAVETIMFKMFSGTEAERAATCRSMLAASEAFEKRFPDRKDAVAFYKFMALLEIDRDKVPAILEQMAADPLSRYINLTDAAGLTLQKEGLSKATYAAVAKVLERSLRNEYFAPNTGGSASQIHRSMADAYAKAGQPGKAVEAIGKAIAKAREEKAPADRLDALNQDLRNYTSQVSASH